MIVGGFSRVSLFPIKERLIKILGKDEYNELTELFNQAREDSIQHPIEKSEDKFEHRLLEFKIELKDEMRNPLKWMISLWITQMVAIISILVAVVIK